MTPWTLVMAYYDNPGMLQEHARHLFQAVRPELTRALHLVIVDDGSPRYPAAPIAAAIDWSHLASFQLWRMGVDVRWNQDACRNIGVREAKSQWVLLTDMDHVVPNETWERLMLQKLNKHLVYRFGRVSMPDLFPYKSHPNSWALTVKKYWQVGGYDEALAGWYGTDGDFLVRVKRTIERDPVELPEVLRRYPREVIADASTTTLDRKNIEDKKAIAQIIARRRLLENWSPRLFSFPCERVL